MRFLVIFLTSLLMFSCSNDSDDNNTEIEGEFTNFEFSDGFETGTDDIMELFPSDGSRWTNLQIVSPNGEENTLSLSAAQVSEGQQSLLIETQQSDEILSKADIEKSGFLAPENSLVVIQADFYIDSDINIENLFLIDLECCSCWDPSVPDNQCPGIRLVMSGGNDYLSIERGKIAASTLAQSSFRFPRQEWVTVRWEMRLSDENDALNQLFINDQQVISEGGMNMPNAEVFRDLFAENGIDFQLRQPVAYERLQIGATANPDAGNLALWVDNFTMRVTQN